MDERAEYIKQFSYYWGRSFDEAVLTSPECEVLCKTLDNLVEEVKVK